MSMHWRSAWLLAAPLGTVLTLSLANASPPSQTPRATPIGS